jgi:EAL domain-containing protein (putative c-di-GMP-specific phosphodiesterase class I)
MSHELRTPLNAVIGFAELIHDGKVGPIFPDQKEYLGDILTSSRHLLRLINDALDLTRFESGRVEFRPEPLDLARTVGEVTDGLDGLAARKRIRVEAEIDPSLDGIVSDPASLKQILYNYLSNALKFTPDEGRVVVRVRPEPPDLFRIEVEDTGIGIRTEDLGRLFVEFQQLDAGAAKKYQGTGLGLALTKRIVEAQGGHVGVRSVPGSGSTFFAVLPRSPRPARGAQTVSASQQPAAPPRGRVLLADDDDALREVYATILSEAGHEVETARDGRAAMDLIWKNAYDVVLSDISMPGMTGVQVLRAVRQRDLDVPVVLMTGNPMLETAIQAIEHGALGYLLKPVIRDTLLRTVDEALRLNRLARLKREALSYLGAEDKLLGDRASLEATFTRALTTVWMAYQPIVRASDSAVAGHEALMRAAEPALASPTALLDAAERLRRIPELGRIVRDLVAAAMNDGGPAGPVFINLHPLELMDEALFVTSVGLSRRADDVILEVTERASVAGMVDLQERVKALRGLGYRIALDDLGAGYAGLSSFAVLRPDFVKIDMALVRGVDRDPMKRRLITSMTAVCRDSGITVVAEGIETEAEREVVVSAGCDLLQGYLFGRPVRAQTHLTA